MKTLKYYLIALLLPAIMFTSCKDDGDGDGEETKSTHEILADHLVTSNLDLPVILTDWIIAAPAEADLASFVDSYNVIDIRNSTDYTTGHIEGAVNSVLTDIVTTAGTFTADKPVLVVCYTGQTAGHAVVALRLSGYEDAKVLKWGMSGWNSTLSAPWADQAKQYDDLSNWSTTKDLADAIVYGEPTVSVNSVDGATILAQQVTSMLAGGLAGINQSDVLATPTNYYINNYWAETDVDTYGNIKTTYRINPLSIANDEIYSLNPDADIVTYCWTGQTSSMITAYLTVLGYDALSLKFGANGMIYDNLQAHKFTTPTVDLTLVQ